MSIEDWLNAQGTACEDYTDAQLESLTGFSVKDQPQLTTLKSGDFAGMPNIANLDLQRNSSTSLPADIFEGLDAVADLRIGRNELTELPDGIFAGLPNLVTLTADGNYFTSIDSDWFDGFEGGGTLTRFVVVVREGIKHTGMRCQRWCRIDRVSKMKHGTNVLNHSIKGFLGNRCT